jgi:hypothetical protein
MASTQLVSVTITKTVSARMDSPLWMSRVADRRRRLPIHGVGLPTGRSVAAILLHM